MDSARRKTRVCNSCKQELSHAAFYRHLKDKTGAVCRGKQRVVSHTDVSSESESDSDLNVFSSSEQSDSNLDTTFDFGTDSDNSCRIRQSMNSTNSESFQNWVSPISPMANSDTEARYDSISYIESADESEGLEEIWESSGEEIWENSDVERDGDLVPASTNHLSKRILLGISLFVTTFQLLFRISERAMSALLLFLQTLTTYLASIINHALLTELCRILPKSMSKARKIFGVTNKGVVEFIVCPKCNALYKLSDCVVRVGGREESNRCSYVEFPNHPQQSRRMKCNTLLMKSVKIGGKSKLVPRKVYHYHSIIHTLHQFVLRKEFLSKCEQWRNRPDLTAKDMYGDIYDGKVWKELQYIDDIPFLSAPHNYCLLLNVDWFNPFDETEYSAGVIYLVIENLPRSERYKFENVILVGMIPGPKEPKRDINTFLVPLVNDFKVLFQGVTFENPNSHFGSTTIRALISCTGSDLPATRKICGFLSYNAEKGCSKCLKSFPTESFGDKPDFSGYDCENWEARKHTEHVAKALLVKNARTASGRSLQERNSGVRYSELLNLPHFDVVRFHVIDPMHNIFLGIAKHTVKLWKEKKVLTVNDFEALQNRVNSMNPPPNIGRIPRKIESGFASFTADEWKHWILIYSLYALHGILPCRDYNCWLFFVEACKLLCQMTVTKAEVIGAHELLLKFCRTFQDLYGAEKCTPNMHMACHLKECVFDYGPLPAFWCFSFERYNGTMERMSLSWLGPEKQMFSKFINLQYILHTLEDSDICTSNDFLGIASKCIQQFKGTKVHSSVEQTAIEGNAIINQTIYHTCPVSGIDCREKSYHKLFSPLIEKVFNDAEMCHLQDMYNNLYPSVEYEVVRPSRFYLQSKQISVNGELFICTKSRSQQSAAIVAHWPSVLGIDTRGEAPLRAGIVTYFFRHQVQVKSRTSNSILNTNILAHVKWMEDHPYRDRHVPTTFVSTRTYVSDNCASFIPVARIAGRCAVAEATVTFDYGEDNVNICVPLLKNVLV